MKSIIPLLFSVLISGPASFANTSTELSIVAVDVNASSVSEKLLRTFKNTFPDAQEVRWKETTGKFTVNFKASGLLTIVDYDKDGEFISSVRYYTESNLPVNILCKLHKKYPERKVFGVIEKTTDSNVEYFIKLEDAVSWVTVRSNSEGSMSVVEKYKKASE